MATDYESYEWLSESDLSKYGGKWIAVANRAVIAVGEIPSEVLKEARKKAHNPILRKISDNLRVL